MKANLTTRIEHTINFYSFEKFAIKGYYGLKDLFLNSLNKNLNENIEILNVGTQSNIKFKNISQEVLDEDDLKVFHSERVDVYYVRLMLTYLVNREILPPGDYCITFLIDER